MCFLMGGQRDDLEDSQASKQGIALMAAERVEPDHTDDCICLAHRSKQSDQCRLKKTAQNQQSSVAASSSYECVAAPASRRAVVCQSMHDQPKPSGRCQHRHHFTVPFHRHRQSVSGQSFRQRIRLITPRETHW